MSVITAFLAGIVVGWIIVAMAFPIVKHFKERIRIKRLQQYYEAVKIQKQIEQWLNILRKTS